MTNEEAIQRLDNLRCENPLILSMDVAALDLAIAALERDRWISVEDRLPEPDSRNRYIVYAIEPWFGTKVIDFMRFGGQWLYDGKPTEATVTHWMPLPEPPKEET